MGGGGGGGRVKAITRTAYAVKNEIWYLNPTNGYTCRVDGRLIKSIFTA
jgi:hypothetical protein